MSESQDGMTDKIAPAAADFDLDGFFPYQIRAFYMGVATAVSAVYREKYDLTPADWRVLATIGCKDSVTSVQIAVHARMDKVTISRSVARLKTRGWVVTSESNADRRHKTLRLSGSGKRVFKTLIPRVREVERSMLAGISDGELRALKKVLNRITRNTEQLL